LKLKRLKIVMLFVIVQNALITDNYLYILDIDSSVENMVYCVYNKL